MNKVILIGNLTRDPELSTTPSGTSVCRFGLAVSRRFANREGTRETDFFNITVWGAQGENCHRFLRKGNKAGIVGRVQISTYDDRDGNKRTAIDIIADEVEFLSPKSGGDYPDDMDGFADSPRPKKTTELQPIEDDDLPF